VAGIIGLLLVVALSLGYVLSRWQTQPLERISAAAEAISEGTDDASLPSGRRDEIGTLARSLERMLTRLQSRRQDLEAANERLRRANVDLEHFAHIASHDLREPARRVATMANLIESGEGANLSTHGRELLGRMQRSSVRMLDQITELRTMANLAHTTMVRTPTDIGATIRAVLDEHAPVIEARRVRVSVEECPTLEVYPTMVEVLYRNLVDNALVHARGDEFELTCTARRDRSGWILGVRNTGSEIDEADLERIFAPFTKLRGGAENVGMGLSVCRRIVERHSGAIWAQSGSGFVHVEFRFEESANGHV
jgi:signal transduction histidine kinase